MSLTPAQKVTLRSNILADNTLAAQVTAQDWDGIAAIYNAVASPTFFVYRSNVPVQEIVNGIQWANLTPIDAPDGTQTWANRSLACQGKQFNVQMMLQSGGANAQLNAAFANLRAGLQDALTNVPAGASGALVSAGWVAIRDGVLARSATRLEKLFATVTVPQDGSTAAKAATLVVEAAVSAQTVSDAMGGL